MTRPDRSPSAESADRLALVVARIRDEMTPGHRLGRSTGRELAQLCREIWTDRERFLGSKEVPQAVGTANRVRDDLIDLVALSVDLEARSQPDDPAQTRRDGLRRLDEAIALLGPSPILDHAKATLLANETEATSRRRP